MKRFIVTNGRAFAAAGKNTYVKEVLRAGEYRHPVAGWELKADEAYLQSVAAQSNAALAAGVRVPVPDGHSHDAKGVAGWAQEFFVGAAEDGKPALFSRLEITDEEYARKVDDGSIAAVSVYLDDLGDGEYTPDSDRVVHVALTAYPVASKQGGFVRLSVDSPEIPVLVTNEEYHDMKFDLSIEKAKAFGIEIPEGHEGETLSVDAEALVGVADTALAARNEAQAAVEAAKQEAEAAKVALAAVESAQPFGVEAAARALAIDPKQDRYFDRARKSLAAAVEGEITLALEKGKIDKRGEEILRTLLTTEHAFSLSDKGEAESVDVAEKVKALLGLIPEGAAVPTSEMDVSTVDADPDPDAAKKASIDRMSEAANK